jgi:hypothetical protein
MAHSGEAGGKDMSKRNESIMRYAAEKSGMPLDETTRALSEDIISALDDGMAWIEGKTQLPPGIKMWAIDLQEPVNALREHADSILGDGETE